VEGAVNPRRGVDASFIKDPAWPRSVEECFIASDGPNSPDTAIEEIT